MATFLPIEDLKNPLIIFEVSLYNYKDKEGQELKQALVLF
jgi:hypothetical protein